MSAAVCPWPPPAADERRWVKLVIASDPGRPWWVPSGAVVRVARFRPGSHLGWVQVRREPDLSWQLLVDLRESDVLVGWGADAPPADVSGDACSPHGIPRPVGVR